LLFLLSLFFSKDLALGALILIATPSGLSSVVISDLVKGNNELSLAFTIVSHVLSSIYVPLIIFIATQELVSFDYIGLFLSLFQIVFIPIVLSFLIKMRFSKRIQSYSKHFSAITVILIFLLSSP